MKIGVISDTHLKESNPLLENIVERYFKDVDLILHAGDITSMEVLNVFKEKEIVAVFGNNDPSGVRKRLPQKEVITVDNFKIGLIHGWGFPMRLKKRVRDSFQGVHCLVYGHSHWAVNIRQNGILYFFYLIHTFRTCWRSVTPRNTFLIPSCIRVIIPSFTA